MTADAYAVIRDILTTTFMVPDHEIVPEATLAQLQLDSLALAEFALITQERLGVKIVQENTELSTTLGEVAAYLDGERAKTAVTS